MNIIEIKNVSKSFNKHTVIDNITLSVTKGKITGIIGPNGSGKTTLLRLIATLLTPDSGTIFLDGINAVKNPFSARKKFGLLFGGDATLYDKMTAYENLVFHAQLQNIPQNETESKIKELVKIFHMENYINKNVSVFSRGMRQKVAFSKSIIHNPDLLLLDEPSTGLDIDSIIEIHSFIKQYKNEEKTVVITSHNMNELESLCDNIIIIKNGKILTDSQVSTLKESTGKKSIESIYKYYINTNNFQG